MKRTLAKILSLVLAVSALMTTAALAAEPPATVLTDETVAALQALPYTSPEGAVTYEAAQTRYAPSTLRFLYGDRTGFDDFAVAHDHLMNAMKRSAAYTFPALGKTHAGLTNEAFYSTLVDEAKAEVAYASDHLTVTLHTDPALLYQGDCMDRTTAALRGVVEARLYVNPLELEGAETAYLNQLGFSQLYKDEPMFIDADIHMATQSGSAVTIHTIVPLGEAY